MSLVDNVEQTWVDFSYYDEQRKDNQNKLISQIYQEQRDVILKLNQIQEKETETMNYEVEEFLLGTCFVIKDAVDNICDGQAMIVCPDMDVENFTVNLNEDAGCINVVAVYGECPNCGEPVVNEFCFMLNDCYKLKSKSYNVRNGLFILQVEYNVENNVDVDENL